MARKKINIWKIVAIVFIILFAAIMFGGWMKAYHFRTSFITPTRSQVDIAKNAALTDLKNHGEDLTNYSFKISDKIRGISIGSAPRETIEVSVYNASIRHLYIIDVNSGGILMYSRIEFYDGLNHSIDISPSREMDQGGQKGFFNR
jgi:hypothetical protein